MASLVGYVGAPGDSMDPEFNPKFMSMSEQQSHVQQGSRHMGSHNSASDSESDSDSDSNDDEMRMDTGESIASATDGSAAAGDVRTVGVPKINDDDGDKDGDQQGHSTLEEGGQLDKIGMEVDDDDGAGENAAAETDSEEELEEEMTDEDRLRRLVGCNPIIMPKIVEHVGSLKDRATLERTTRQLKRWSETLPYKPGSGRHDLLEATFQHADERMTLTVGDAQIEIPFLVCSKRRFITLDTMTNTQQTQTLDVTRKFLTRLTKQISTLRIGGLIHWEDVIGLLPNHQLVITEDFAQLLDEYLIGVTNLCMRNLCVDHNAVQAMLRPEFRLRDRITDMCLHSIWFDDLDDCDNFTVNFVPPRLDTLCISDCCNKMLNDMAGVLRERNQRVGYCFLSMDIRSFDTSNKKPPRHAFRDIINQCDRVGFELRCNTKSEYMYHAVSDLTRFPQITYVELQLDRGIMNDCTYAAAFKKFRRLVNLEVLRISGHGYALQRPTVEHLANALPYLTNLKEFCLRNAGWNLTEAAYNPLADNLKNLRVLGFDRCPRLSNQQLLKVLENCPDLEMLHLQKCTGVELRTPVLQQILVHLCPNLQSLVIDHMRVVDAHVFTLLADESQTPAIKCAVIGGNRKRVDNELLRRLKSRFNVALDIGDVENNTYTKRPRGVTYKFARDGCERYFDWVGKFGVCPKCRQFVNYTDDDSL